MGEHRGGFGVNYKIRIRRGEAVASMVMDHGRSGPLGAQGGDDGGLNRVRIMRSTVNLMCHRICRKTRASCSRQAT